MYGEIILKIIDYLKVIRLFLFGFFIIIAEAVLLFIGFLIGLISLILIFVNFEPSSLLIYLLVLITYGIHYLIKYKNPDKFKQEGSKLGNKVFVELADWGMSFAVVVSLINLINKFFVLNLSSPLFNKITVFIHDLEQFLPTFFSYITIGLIFKILPLLPPIIIGLIALEKKKGLKLSISTVLIFLCTMLFALFPFIYLQTIPIQGFIDNLAQYPIMTSLASYFIGIPLIGYLKLLYWGPYSNNPKA